MSQNNNKHCEQKMPLSLVSEIWHRLHKSMFNVAETGYSSLKSNHQINQKYYVCL